jgi:leader peptidase (prepilin peptidase)/N-methyltransferase
MIPEGGPLLAVVLGLFGLCIGSFLNVCIHRLPRRESVVTPGSRCPQCGTAIRWYDNLPVISYLVLGGRCRACGNGYSSRYMWVELITGVVFAAHALVFDAGPLLAVRLVLAAMLIALFAIDLEHQILPDAITFPGIAIGLIASVWLPPGLLASAIGAAMGAAILLGIRWAWKRMTGVDAMGLGDVKMLAMVGAFLGWQQVWLVLFLSSLTGAAAGIAITMSRRGSMQTKLPFGTFIAVATLIASLWGDAIVSWYVGLVTYQ